VGNALLAGGGGQASTGCARRGAQCSGCERRGAGARAATGVAVKPQRPPIPHDPDTHLAPARPQTRPLGPQQGATGLIGSRLAAKLAAQGHRVRVLARDPAAARAKLPYPGLEFHGPAAWAGAVAGAGAVVNLAGTPIGTRCAGFGEGGRTGLGRRPEGRDRAPGPTDLAAGALGAARPGRPRRARQGAGARSAARGSDPESRAPQPPGGPPR
jgi:hypothetical protein